MPVVVKYLAAAAAALGICLALPSHAAEKFGVFETIFESSASFTETTDGIEAAIAQSGLLLHGAHSVGVPDDAHEAKLYVLTSPEYAAAAAAESSRTVSAQVLRIAVFTWGDEQKVFVNMANPLPQAMVFYARSPNYDALIMAAQAAAAEMRGLVAGIPGQTVSRQNKPMRTEKHYRKYKGDGPARMMAKFRRWQKSQLLIGQASGDEFEAVVDRVIAALEAGEVSDASASTGWEKIAVIRIRDDAVHIGLTNPFIEDKMVRINSRFRGKDKTDASPYPGVDHIAALPTDVLIVKDGDQTKVLHYGQMWRMQLYFWDSGYRAFTANVGVPGKIAKSIDAAVSPALQ